MKRRIQAVFSIAFSALNREQGIAYFFLLFLAASGIFAQQEVVLKISEGTPMIPIALPDFIDRSGSPHAQAAAAEIHQVLADDIKYSRIFQLLPKSDYDLIGGLATADKINFKDWEGIQASLLIAGEVREDSGHVIFDGIIYDVKSERLSIRKRYQAEKNGLRLVAHKMDDELLKVHGEKPIFTTKIAYVSNRDGNDEIYMMDYDSLNLYYVFAFTLAETDMFHPRAPSSHTNIFGERNIIGSIISLFPETLSLVCAGR